MVPEIHEAYKQCFQRMAINLKNAKNTEVANALPKSVSSNGSGVNTIAKLVAMENLNEFIAQDVGKLIYPADPEIKNVLITGGAGFM